MPDDTVYHSTNPELEVTLFSQLPSCAAVISFILSASAALAFEAPTKEQRQAIETGLTELQKLIDQLNTRSELSNRKGQQLIADVAVFAKAAEWQLKHDEFQKKGYPQQALSAIEIGTRRARELLDGKSSWQLATGSTVRGYVSRIDGSVQPYAISLPEDVNPSSGDRWPLHLKLHGRANDMNESNFIKRHEGKKLPEGQTWIQLDVYGRGNNAYRWAGETDVFEALKDVQRRFRIDANRITLHGFSMGGAGAWHLGMHHPHLWSSVGPGAGFVDFYKYQNQSEQRPPWQHANLGIYDAVDYALNAANVPVCTYGGEKDAQLLASTTMVDAAKKKGVDIKLLIGPGMGHKFHPDSYKEFMAFHQQHSTTGRKTNRARTSIRFETRTLKYNRCDWLTVHEVERVYEPSAVECKLNDDGDIDVLTSNVRVFSIFRDIGQNVIVDGITLPCSDAAEGLLPNVDYMKTEDGWRVLSYNESKDFLNNSDLRKRHNLQGPIDDAFMESFVCVTGDAPKTDLEKWSLWTQKRFHNEYDKWLRATVPTVAHTDLTDNHIADSHLALFGSPATNSVMKKVLPDLPITWTDDTITVGGKSYSTSDHAVSLIFPNPLNPRRYVVINSGHTFHEKDFKASNSWLFPRLGDIAVQKSVPTDDGYREEIVWAANFDTDWQLPE